MEAIKPLWEQMPLQPLRRTESTASNSVSFGRLFSRAVQNAATNAYAAVIDPVSILENNPVTDMLGAAVDAVKESDNDLRQMEYMMATGQLDNPAPLLIAASKAQTSVVQLRNRALDAYNELMRISL